MTFWGRIPNTINQLEDVLRTGRSLIAVSRLFYQLATPLLLRQGRSLVLDGPCKHGRLWESMSQAFGLPRNSSRG